MHTDAISTTVTPACKFSVASPCEVAGADNADEKHADDNADDTDEEDDDGNEEVGCSVGAVIGGGGGADASVGGK